ncbi:FUSC family protein [Terrabacter carboxydivorans]|uniref:FUSC family protein n=1 Tax=Terrabacter carboxydivorans TaxID=619730 RepID=A0ABP5ZK10_9MICO
MTSEPEPTADRGPGGRPRGARAVTRGLVALGPHRGAHRVALRAGLSVLMPLLVLVLAGRVEWTAYAAFGAFTSLYGRNHARAERAGMQVVAGGFLTLSVTLGVLVSLAPDSRWLVVPVGALLAAGGSLASDAYGWHPPGPLFLVFGFAVSAMVPATAATLPVAAGVAALSALFSLAVAQVGVLREPASWAPPVLPAPRFRDALAPQGAVTHLLRHVLALSVAGGVATALDWQHPYWAMVAAVVVLSGPDLLSRLTRGVQRVVGTLLGLGVAALVLAWHPQGVTAVLVIVVLQVLTELFVGRNYAVALLFITPLALLMGQLAHEAPVGPLLRDRLLETVLGALVGAVVLLLVPDRPPGPDA